MKWRYLANSYAYCVSIPTNPLAAKIAFAFQKTPLKWRGSFIFMAGVNVLSVLCWYFFYFPPTFRMLHRKRLAKEMLMHFDWIGLLLYVGGLLVFLLGLNWGGSRKTDSMPGRSKRSADLSVYPWSSSYVIGALVAGAVGLFGLFPLWEVYLPFRNIEPFLPLHLFTNLNFQACAWLTGIGELSRIDSLDDPRD